MLNDCQSCFHRDIENCFHLPNIYLLRGRKLNATLKVTLLLLKTCFDVFVVLSQSTRLILTTGKQNYF